MSLRSNLKTIVPRSAWRLASSLSRLPELLAVDRSQQICNGQGIATGAIAFAEDLVVRLPDNAVANSIYRMHFFEHRHRTELQDFLRLAEGRTNFIDIGASGGVFSALFAASRPNYDIISVEPDEPSLAVLRQVKERNHRDGSTWIIAPSVLSDAAGAVTYESGGYGGEIVHPSNTVREAAQINCQEYRQLTLTTETLSSLLARNGFKPDLIKFDIEGYEHEVICSSADVLRQFRPRIALELHIEKLGHRGIDPLASVRVLAGIGYRRFTDGAAIEPIVRAATSRNVLHLTLAA